MAKKKKAKKKSKKSKKTRRKKSRKVRDAKKKTRKVNKSKKTRKRKSKKVKKRRKSKSSKSKKPRKINFKAAKLSEDADGKSLIKVSDSWANHAYVNKSQYLKKYKLSIIQKLRMLNTVKTMLRLNGTMMEHLMLQPIV